jgi:hypothetical protein
MSGRHATILGSLTLQERAANVAVSIFFVRQDGCLNKAIRPSD